MGNNVKCPRRDNTLEPTKFGSSEPARRSQFGSLEPSKFGNLEPTKFGRAELNEKALQVAEPVIDVEAGAEKVSTKKVSTKKTVPADYHQSMATVSKEPPKFGNVELNEEGWQETEPMIHEETIAEKASSKQDVPADYQQSLAADFEEPPKVDSAEGAEQTTHVEEKLSAPEQVARPSADLATESTPSQVKSSGPIYFMATLEKEPGTRWLMDIDYNQKQCLKVLEVFDGPIMRYNELHPDEKIEDGDLLEQVNDKRGSPIEMAEMLRDSDRIEVRVRKRKTKDKAIRFTSTWNKDPMEMLAKGKADSEALQQKSVEAEDSKVLENLDPDVIGSSKSNDYVKVDVIDSKPKPFMLLKGNVRDLNIDKGFGFIRPQRGGSGDAFFSFTGLLNCKTVEVGDAVTYIEDDEMIEGQLCAVEVTKDDTE